MPEGVVNVVTGSGSIVGKRLVEHPTVAKVAFTGSTQVGAGIMKGAADTIKRVTLELGGKSANIVFADADLEAAATAAPPAVFGNAGQDCCARSRILVQREAFDSFASLFVEATAKMRVGDPEDDATEMGPLVSEDQREKVASYVDDDVMFAADVPEGTGYWYPPTVLGPVGNDARQAQEEIFGPVACLIPFADEDEAVRIANDTPYGLSGSIWTRRRGPSGPRGQASRCRGSLCQLEHIRAAFHSFRGHEAIRIRSGARDARARRILGRQERLYLDGGLTACVAWMERSA